MDTIKAPEELPNPRPSRNLPGPSFWIAAALLLVLSVILAFVPLFNVLGYEYCAAIALLASMTAGPVAIGVARRRKIVLAEDARPSKVVAGLFLRAILVNAITLGLPLTVMLLNALRVTNCNLSTGFLFFLLLPIGTIVVCSGWGISIGLVIRRRFLGGLIYSLVWIGVVVWNIGEFWAGPQVDSYNQLVGWIAGPIFDEVVEPGWPLIASRIFGLTWALALLGLSTTFFDTHLNRVRPGVGLRNWRSAVTTAVLALAGLVLLFSSTWLGFGRSRAAVERFLSGTTRTRHFVIHHLPDLPEEKTRLLARDHEYRFDQIEKLIGEQILPAVHSYVFPDSSSKRKLAGAGRTQFAKPWQYAIYINDADFPHPILKHELTHAVAGGFGTWPFRASARSILWQNVGLIEGLAVAVDWPTRKFDPHVWSAAQRRIGKAPDIRQLFDPLGFWSKSAGRSYILAGSFVRFLLDRHGPVKFRQAYVVGSLEGAYPVSGEELVVEWERFLDGLELDPGVVEAARLRFSRPGIFGRTCAHEISALRSEAGTMMAKGKYPRAAELVEQMLGHLPGDPDSLELLAEVRAREEKYALALSILEELSARDDLSRARKARIGNRRGDFLARLGRTAEAEEQWKTLLAAHINDGTDRMTAVKLEALRHSQAGADVLHFLQERKVNAATLLALREAADKEPHWGTIWYLLGRQLFNRDLFEKCIPYLERAGSTGLGDPALAAENLRLLVQSYYREGELRQAAATLSVLAHTPRHQGDLLWTLDWLGRIRFEQKLNAGESRKPLEKK